MWMARTPRRIEAEGPYPEPHRGPGRRLPGPPRVAAAAGRRTRHRRRRAEGSLGRGGRRAQLEHLLDRLFLRCLGFDEGAIAAVPDVDGCQRAIINDGHVTIRDFVLGIAIDIVQLAQDGVLAVRRNQIDILDQTTLERIGLKRLLSPPARMILRNLQRRPFRTSVSVVGIAFAGARGISGVQVRVDGGEWQDAELRSPLSETTWVIWRYEWPFVEGDHLFEVRCRELDGTPQIEEETDNRPDGATGIDSLQAQMVG